MKKITRAIFVLLTAGLLSITGSSCSTKARHLAQANKYFDAGDYSKAETEYLSIVRTDRRNAVAFKNLGIIFLEEGRLRSAVQVLVLAQDLAPNDVTVRLKLGTAYAGAGMLKEARTNAFFVLDRKPDDLAAPLLLADTVNAPADAQAIIQRLQNLSVAPANRATIEVAVGGIYYRLRDVKAASAAFERARALNPNLPEVWAGMGTVYWEQKDTNAADAALKKAADLAPPRSPLWLGYAKFKISSGDPAAAKSFLEGVVRTTPDYLPAWLVLAEISAVEKKYDEANVAVEKVLAVDPYHYEALMMSGRLALAQNDPATAIAKFEKLAKAYERSAPVHYELGTAYELNNEPAKGIASFAQAVKLSPGYAPAVLALADLKLKQGEVDDALASLLKFVKQQPKNSQGQILLAQAYGQKGNFEEALNLYRKLEEVNPDSALLPLREGFVLNAQKKTGEARKAFERALQLAPEDPVPLEQLTALDVGDKQYGKALQRLEAQLKREPKAQLPRLIMAKVYVLQGDKNQAIDSLSKAVEAEPDFAAAALLLSQLYAEEKQYPKSLEVLQKMLAKDPKNRLALMRLGMVQTDLKNYPAARDAYESLLAGDPKFGPALNNLALLYSENFDQLDKAYDLARRARDLNPPDPTIAPYTADTLGWILYKRGEYAQALSLLQEGVNTFPDDPEGQFHLGMDSYMTGDEEAARSALRFALQASKTFRGKDGIPATLAVLAVDVQTAGADARALLEKRVAEQPGDPIALSRLAAIYKRDGNADKAIATYEAALKANPKNAPAFADLAQLYSARPGDVEKAFGLAKTAYKLAPEDPRVARTLGRVAFLTGDYRWSLSLLGEVARKGAADSELLYDLAQASYSRGQVTDAETEMRSALQGGANFSRAAGAKQFLDMLTLSANPPQATAASAQVEQALKSDPNYVPALMAMGAIDEQKTDTNAAIQAYEKVLERYPDFSPAKRRLVILYSDSPANDKKASALGAAAREAFPDDLDVAEALGIINYRQGEFPRAERLLSEVAGKKSDDARLMYFLGMTQFQLKRPAESKKNLQRALELKLPDNFTGEARRVLALLK